ncbi:hypothetical protein, partial [Rhizobium laguerreae]|uniref:hypothetical protein n=1 Tax=Rhizobium laguerreae TaxID=1076926 RepID=UPI00197EC783
RARAGSADDRWYFMAVVPMMDMQGVANVADDAACRIRRETWLPAAVDLTPCLDTLGTAATVPFSGLGGLCENCSNEPNGYQVH